MWLYRLFAWIIMPGSQHDATRHLFVSHARRLGKAEFTRWFDLNYEVIDFMKRSAARLQAIPTLYIMGDHDYMFGHYAILRSLARADSKTIVVADCGHVVPVEKPFEFNRLVIEFIDSLSNVEVQFCADRQL
jgi:pimeloyl-ACP methyl ester carboxylesterase